MSAILQLYIPRIATKRKLMVVTGKLRKQLIVDLSVAFGLGITGGYAFWFGYHIPAVRQRDAFYAKLESEGHGMSTIFIQ
jgi:cytochrome c oxidase subunit 7